jgi:hypothetical protein
MGSRGSGVLVALHVTVLTQILPKATKKKREKKKKKRERNCTKYSVKDLEK